MATPWLIVNRVSWHFWSKHCTLPIITRASTDADRRRSLFSISTAPVTAGVTPHRDVSAGAIAASALFELARYAPPDRAKRYRGLCRKGALFIYRSLHTGMSTDDNGHFLLSHSVGNYPINDEIDVAINYADYYYIERSDAWRCGRNLTTDWHRCENYGP